MLLFLLQEPLDAHFNLGDFDKPTDFSNPMYDVIGTTQNSDKGPYEEGTKSSPPVRKSALDPTPLETDKDTAQLVVEDKSEC
jgi:low density lipoprotein-related protein 2